MKLIHWLGSLVVCLGLLACGYVAEHTAPNKRPATTRTALAVDADQRFWSTLHGGDYSQIALAVQVETAAYLEQPEDAVTAAHVGWLHIWRVSESRRLESAPASITDDVVLARKYFEQSVELNPNEARYLGFLASATLAEGSIHHDERETRRGYYLLLDAIKAWPEFNLFTAGYVMSGQPSTSQHFRQALDWEWQDLDVCVGERVDRGSGAYAKYLHLETRQGVKRVCWNSEIAPHNFEGFFLNMGDMLVKSGDWQLARKVYANAKLSSTYDEWKFRETLEDRIREAAANVGAFNAPETHRGDQQRIMASSSFSCVACHQQ